MIPYQNSIGIEIKEDALVLVHLTKTLKETRVQSSLVIPLSFPLSPVAEAEVVDSLKKFLLHSRVKSERVVVGIPRRSVILKSLEIPSIKKEDIPRVLEYEIERHLPFNPEEVYYDFDVIEKTGENLYRIFLAAVKKDIIDSFSALFERVTLRPKIFDLSSFGIFNALMFGNRISENGIDGIIFFDSKDMELEILQAGLLRYSRTFAYGASPGDGAGDGDFSVEFLSKELENALSVIDTKGNEKKIHNLILSGPGSLRPGLIESIRERISTDIRIEDLSKKVMARPMEPQDRHILVPAIGLALRGLGEGKVRINFLPHEPEIKMGKKELSLAIGLAGTVISLGLALFLSYPIKDGIELRRIEKRIDTLRPEANAVEKIQREIKSIEDKNSLLARTEEEDLSKLDILAELTRVIPSDTWLVSLDYTETLEQKGQKEANGKIKREVIISGFATSASKLIPLLEDSPVFENVEFAGPITSGPESSSGSGKERFRIKTLPKKVGLSPVQDKPEVKKEEAPKKEVTTKDGIKEETILPEPPNNQKQPFPQRPEPDGSGQRLRGR